jgi:addiction module RelE/StbE family toxin
MTIRPDKVFLKRANKLLKNNPQLRTAYIELYDKLANDPFEPALHTHPLTGALKGKYACSLTHKLRVVFRLYDDTIHLLDIGSHDEVY